jgi:hypothetical protein
MSAALSDPFSLASNCTFLLATAQQFAWFSKTMISFHIFVFEFCLVIDEKLKTSFSRILVKHPHIEKMTAVFKIAKQNILRQ